MFDGGNIILIKKWEVYRKVVKLAKPVKWWKTATENDIVGLLMVSFYLKNSLSRKEL